MPAFGIKCLTIALTACAAASAMGAPVDSVKWFNTHFNPKTTKAPFSFTYGGKPSGELLKSCKASVKDTNLDKARTKREITWTDPTTGLRVCCVAVAYKNFPTVEWTLYFRNTSKIDTPIIENVLALDTTFTRGEPGEFLLHHFRGTPCTAADYEPFETALGPGATKKIAAAGGRPTSSDMSYFNIEWAGAGAILAVGWPGQWSSEFVRDSAKNLTVKAGQELTHFKLLPGEQVRSPLMVVQFYQGYWFHAQNV